MRLLRRLGPLAGSFAVTLGLLWLPTTSSAQSALNSSMATQLLQGLSPQQQQAVQNLLGGGGTPGGLPSSLGGQGNQLQAQQQQLQQQQAVEAKRQGLLQQQQPLIPQLQGGDWVIVQIGVTLPPPLITSSESAMLQQASGAQTNLSLNPSAALSALQGASANGASVVPSTGLSPSDMGTGTQPQQTGQTAHTQELQQLPPDLAEYAAELTPLTPELEQLQPEELKSIAVMIRAIREHDPYQLSHDGTLSLPGFEPIQLLGLTEGEATLRLSVIPAFQYLQVRVTLLPLQKTGQEALEAFGYDVFAQQASTYTSLSPLTSVPVPSNYRVGPGDAIDVQLYGNQNEYYPLIVARDGRIDFPQLGPISVGGQLFSAVQAQIESRVAHQMIGVRASVTMSETRAIQVFVMGDAFQPGVYTVSGLGTMTSALYAAGGISNVGSLRNVELVREGKLINKLDLYDLLIHGSTANDAKLLQGDVVFVPAVGRTVSVDGEVERPAIYEIKDENTPAQAIALAGGLMPDADLPDATITRILPNGRKVALPLELGSVGASEGLRNGDYIHIPRLKPSLDEAVTLQGNVYSPGVYAYRVGMRLTDVLRSVGELKPDSDLRYILIRRELPPDRRVIAVSANLAAALAKPHSSADVLLMPRDQITVFDLSSSRDHIVQPILDTLRAESTAENPEQLVTVAGEVNVPGQYPLQPGMRVSDLIRAGGGLANDAYIGKAELTRYVVAPDGVRHTEIDKVDLAKALEGDSQADPTLKPYDILSVEEVSQWGKQDTVTLKGEVRFPGTYTIRPGERLKSVIERAGGLTSWAFLQGAVFTREEIQVREQKEMDLLAQRMQVELSVLALRATATATGNSGGSGANTLIIAKSLLEQLQSEKAVGRLVIDLPRILRQPADSPYDVILRNGDTLIVPKYEQEVTVIGEVQDPTSHLYDPGMSRIGYIDLSGGFTAQADKKRIYVVRANGSVIANGGSFWFSGAGESIRPGDTIVVPINAEQMLPLPFWQAVTGILYNIAIATAAVHAL
jgi:polysaccharide biosynthesis/export protein